MKQQLMTNTLIALLLGFLCFSQTSVIKAAAGDLDTTFNGTGKLRAVVGGGEDAANAIVRQTDGKLIVAGQSTDATGSNFSLVRYNTNGTLDATFGTGGKVLTLIGGGATSVAIQPDGKILAAGSRDNGTNTDFALVRYNSNGTIDTTFGVNGIVITDFSGTNDVVNALAIQTSGTSVVNIVVVGSTNLSSSKTVAIARYNSNGALDPTFDGDGKLTSSLGIRANAVGLQSGKIVVAGDGCSGACGVLLRFNTNGTVDSTFGGTSGVTLTDGSSNVLVSARSLAFYAVFAGEDKIVVVGNTLDSSDLRSVRLWTRDANTGAPDTTFGTGGLVRLSDGSGNGKSVKISFNNSGVANRLAVGTDKNSFGVYLLTLAGALDTSFDGDGFASASIANNDSENAMLVQPDNRIVVAGMTRQTIISNGSFGSATLIYSDTDFGLIRFNSNGTLDATFDGDGKKAEDVGNKNAAAKSTIVQPDGKIIVAGDFAVTRFNTDGTLDTSFDGDGKAKIPFGTISGAAIQPDGKIVVVAGIALPVLLQPPPFLVYRFTASGALDTTFDTDGMALVNFPNNSAFASAVGIQPDGGIVVAGYATNSSGNADFAAARFLPNGAVDTSFDNDGVVTTAIGTGNDAGNAMAIQTDGRIIVAGSAIFGSTTDFALIRYNPDGSLDTTFSFDGKQTTPIGTGNDVANALTLQSNGKIIAVGYDNIFSGNNDFAVVRYNADGSLDTTFDGDGKLTTPIGSFNDVGNAVAIQTDGKILVAGSTESASNVNDFAVVRYNTDGSLDNLYGSGGKVVVDVSGSDDLGNAAALDSSGKTIIAGVANNLFGIVRLLGDTPLSQTYEGDVQSRPLGDGFVDSDDIQQIRRFSIGNNLPYQSNEFQRADCAPRSMSGDGFVDGDDVQQARRFSVGTDGNQIAGGPASLAPPIEDDLINQAITLPFGKQTVRSSDKVTAAPSAFRIDAQNTSAGSTLVVPIRVDTVGNEAGYTFSIAFDSTVLTPQPGNAAVTIGNSGGDVLFNANNSGQIGFSVTTFSGGTIAEGNNKILVYVNFTVAGGAPAGTTAITFTDTPARRKASPVDPNFPITQPSYMGGTITISGATAAGTTLSGRIITAAGRGLSNATVILTDSSGSQRFTRTGAFGYYRFENVEAGQTYIVGVQSKRYKYASQTVSITDEFSELNFYAQP